MGRFEVDVWVSIVSGLLVLCISYVVQQVIVPIAKRISQKSVSLGGTVWQGFNSDDTPSNTTLKISQLGSRITATVELVRTDRPARMFKYSGKIVGRQVVLTWEEKASGGLNVGAFVLRVSNDKSELIGKTVYVNADGEGVTSTDRIYRRALS